MSRTVLVLLTSALGCGRPLDVRPVQPYATPASEVTRRLILTVGGRVQDGHDSPLVGMPALRSGQRLYLLLRSSMPAHGYVAYCSAGGVLNVYPELGALALEREREVRVPERSDFVVDEHPGMETVFVIASAEPLDVLDPVLAGALRRAADRDGDVCAPQLLMSTTTSRQTAGVVPRAPTRRARVPAVPGTYRPRGLFVPGGPPSTATVQSDEAGIAILALTFRHDAE